MVNMLVGAFVGAVIMDFMWAWRLGMPQAMWRRWRGKVRHDDHGV
jgi:hypothetical protein